MTEPVEAPPYVLVDPDDIERRARVVSQVWAVLIVFSLVLMIMVGVLVRLLVAVGDISATQDNLIAGRPESRALQCRAAVQAGADELPSTCFEPDVLAWYRPPDNVRQLPHP